MGPVTGSLLCPKGHLSAEPDYCSECGAKIQGASEASGIASGLQASDGGEVCPDCGTVREQHDIAFCEVCGYNFSTGAHGEVGIVPSSPSWPPADASGEPEPIAEAVDSTAIVDVAATPQTWSVVVSVDPSLRSPESPEPPANFAPYTIDLLQPVSLIGRTNEARAIFPEIALPLDEAVSRRHALLQRGDDGRLLLRDIGAANGTRLNGKDLEPMVDVPLDNGDVITLGHWTRLTVQGN